MHRLEERKQISSWHLLMPSDTAEGPWGWLEASVEAAGEGAAPEDSRVLGHGTGSSSSPAWPSPVLTPSTSAHAAEPPGAGCAYLVAFRLAASKPSVSVFWSRIGSCTSFYGVITLFMSPWYRVTGHLWKPGASLAAPRGGSRLAYVSGAICRVPWPKLAGRVWV